MDKVVFNIGGVNIEMDKEIASKAIEAGEPIELKTEELITYKTDEFETFRKNLADEEYKKGKTAGSEMTIKEGKEKYNLDFEGKTLDNFADAFKSKIIDEANIKPTEKIQELETANKSLRENYTNLESEFGTFKTTIAEKESRAGKDSTILGFIPDNIIVDKDIALMSLKMKAGLDVGDGGIALINGQSTRDKLEEEIKLDKDIVFEKLDTLGLIKKKEGGNGGTDELGGSGKNSYDLFTKEMIANDIQPNSLEFNEEMNKRIANKTLIM